MVSALKNMIWGPAQPAGGGGGSGGNGNSEEEEKKGSATAQAQSELVRKDNIVKEGYLYKQSRYMKQWKRYLHLHFC